MSVEDPNEDSNSSGSKSDDEYAEQRRHFEAQEDNEAFMHGRIDTGKPISERITDALGCYISTACIHAKGLPDNCLELNILRVFRDKILLPNSKGRRAVREYERFAPELVLAINSQHPIQRDKIYQEVYRKIDRAVSAIRSGDFKKAFEDYREMSLALKRDFL